ncbi:MAG: rRNA maturation RNase YbeY [Bdellovibrio sp.]|nr:rRNA maturation RNase YbeY [Bdellovibrio sp.]
MHSANIYEKLATKEVKKILCLVQTCPALSKKCTSGLWKVDIKIVGLTQIKSLNARYLNKNRTTDILSFPAPKEFFRHGYLGELVICLPILKRQARRFSHSLKTELQVLITHGVLHLLGFDHTKNNTQAKQMSKWEKILLNKIGLIERAQSGNKH